MTEAEWLACADPIQLLKMLPTIITDHGFSFCSCCRVRCRRSVRFCQFYRKLRLLTLGCCRRIQSFLPHTVCVAVTNALEEYLENESEVEAYFDAVSAFDITRGARYPKSRTQDDSAWNALYCSVHRKWTEHFDETFAERRIEIAVTTSVDAVDCAGESEKQAQRHGLLDIFGNPFRPIILAPSWLTSTVLALAEGIYADRAFDRLPILADALQDAGCENPNVLDHCRNPNGEHVRGCWVVDEILGLL